MKEFWMDIYETSNAEFELFVNSTGYVTEVCYGHGVVQCQEWDRIRVGTNLGQKHVTGMGCRWHKVWDGT